MHLPDLRTVIPDDGFGIADGPDGPELRYTHLVHNAGAGPLRIQPAYSAAAGTYLGEQELTTHDSSGDWSVVSTRRVADDFRYHAEHGHFHFPLASFGLYAGRRRRRARGGGDDVAQGRVLHLRLLHLRRTGAPRRRRARPLGQLLGPDLAARDARSAAPTSTTTATPGRRSR